MSIYSIKASSKLGCVRTKNEDMILVKDNFIRNDSYSKSIVTNDNDRLVIALADGMGGYSGGELASELTLNDLQFFVHDLQSNLTTSEFNEMMVTWLKSANTLIDKKSRSVAKHKYMGTTLVGIIKYEDKVFWISCGDSRLYLFRNNELTQITIDHSLNVLEGNEKHSNVLTNCIGSQCTTSYLDIKEITDDIMSGDIFLMCSDGLNDMISNIEISTIIGSGGNSDDLCDAAINAGGYDNVSVCLLKVL